MTCDNWLVYNNIVTCNSDSRKLSMIPGIIPLIPPSSMLRTVMKFPCVGGRRGDIVFSIRDWDQNMIMGLGG